MQYLQTVFIILALCWLLWWSLLATMTTLNNDNNSSVATTSLASFTNKTAGSKKRNYNIRLVHLFKYGLGHRLTKMAASYHMWQTQLPTRFYEVNWGQCNMTDDHTVPSEIFTHLFGNNIWERRSSVNDSNIIGSKSNKTRNLMLLSSPYTTTPQSILLRNDVRGYYAAQNYKNHQLEIPKAIFETDWLDKVKSDQALYKTLLDSFVNKHAQVREFMVAHNWDDRLVIGVHIRAGNGEQHHFTNAQRDVLPPMETSVANIATLLRKLVAYVIDNGTANNKDAAYKLEPLVFLATDTASWIGPLKSELGKKRSSDSNNNSDSDTISIAVVTYDQTRVSQDQGVSYQAWTQGNLCLQGWKNSMIDMALLASSNIVVATTHSTFTQTLPLFNVMTQDSSNIAPFQLRYCEVYAMTDMSCFTSIDQWLWKWRNSAWRVSIHDNINNNSISVVDPARSAHKLSIHLPDPDGPDAMVNRVRTWLRRHNAAVNSSSDNEDTFFFGGWLAPKYRNEKIDKQHRPTRWNFVN